MDLLKKWLSSYKTMVILLVIYTLGLAMATFVEKSYSTVMAKVLIYYSPLFFLLQFLLVINFLLILFKRRLYKSGKWGFLIIHLSFIIILAGALISYLTGEEGVLHLREGDKKNQVAVYTNHGQFTHELPFEIELVKFTLKRYPGSMSPSSYESDLRVYVDGEVRNELIYMNNILDIKGYRFFQASYDKDELGTVLSMNRDIIGRNVTYAGYLLLLLGCIFCLVMKNGRIRILYRQIKAQKAGSKLFTILFLMSISLPVIAQDRSKLMSETVKQLEINIEHATQFGSLPLQSTNGRIIPINTFSSEILRKLHKDTHWGPLNSDQFILSVLTYPEMWMYVPVIIVSDDVAHFFGLTPGICSYIEAFDSNGSYKLQQQLEEAYMRMPADRSAFDKELIKFDEKINIFHQLINDQLIRLFPKADDPNQRWYAPGEDLSVFSTEDSVFISTTFWMYLREVREAVKSQNWNNADNLLQTILNYQYAYNNIPNLTANKIALEVEYNQLDIFRWCKIGYLSLGGLLLILSFFLFFKERCWIRWIIRILGCIVLLVFIFQIYGMAMRWKIGGYAPWSNSYETMVYAAWASVCSGLVFIRRSPITFSLATLFAGIILFVSGLNWMDPQINPLVPVLKSPWLMFHVAIIMSAYGFFGISFLIGMINLFMMCISSKKSIITYKQKIKELSLINEISLIIGLLLMTIGTFMGAVWANESWGRYWGWDPKETWALITIVVYVLVTHLHLVNKWYNLWMFNLCSVIAFSSVLMTYFGVNYFLSGMHSYGQNDSIHSIFTYLYIVGIFIILLAVFSRKGRVLK